jgi:acetolactate synthase-1/2/3 large subunit
VAEVIATALAHAGARLAFTVPGESFLPLLDALHAAGIRVVTARHEGGASFMAEAAAQLSGRPQIVLATRSVGAANAAIGIHTARQDSAPLVALIGQVRRSNRGREAFQESDLATGIGSLAKWAAEIGSAERATRLVGEGLRELSHGRPGPILLSLPEDILGVAVSAEAPPSAPAAAAAPDRAAVRQVLRWLAASERGVILAGGGVLHAKASRRLVALSETLAVPVIASWRRPDVIPNDHPNYLGMSGYWAASTVRQRLIDADVVLVLGARLSEVSTFGYRIPGARSRWAHVDLEPRVAVAGLHAPTLAVAADAARFLDACFADLRGVVLDAETRARRVAGIDADRVAYRTASTVDDGDWEGPGVHPGRVIAILQRLLPANAILTSDAGNFAGWATRGYRFTRPGTFVGPTSGAMGYGLPAAIAASLLHPDRVVVALAGDGGFAMTMAELETAVRSGARPIAIVFDNGGYGTIGMHQKREGRPDTSSQLGPIDFAAVATASGALGLRVTDEAGFEPALVEALAAGRPAVIHVALDRSWVSVDQRP